MNIKDSKKNKETMNSGKNEKSLQDWKLPPSSPSDVFKGIRKGIFKCSPDPTVRTVEKEIPISEGFASFPLFTDNLQRVHNQTPYLHIGMIQVGLKPKKLGSNTSAIICLRNKTVPKFYPSVMGMVESSLCDGPIYFSYFPRRCVSLCGPQMSSVLTIDIKTQGSSTMSEEGNAILMYRFHYKLMNGPRTDKKNFRRSLVDGSGETTLFLSNVARSNRVVSKKIYWDQVSVPEIWVDENNPSSVAVGAQGEVARIDWKEEAEVYMLRMDVRGFKKDEVKVEAEAGRVLLISGERRNEEEENGEWRCIERSSGKFLRRLTLPEDANMDEVKAVMENGVLMVLVPKEEVNEKQGVKVIHISG